MATGTKTKKSRKTSLGDSDFLVRQHEELLRENRELRQRLVDKEGTFRKVEILNVSFSHVDFPSMEGEGKTKRLTPYGTPHDRAIVPERDWVYHFEKGFLAIMLGEIRVEKYVEPEDQEVPEEWKGIAYSPDEIKEFLKMKPQDFKDFIDKIEVPEILYRFWIVTDDLNFAISTQENDGEGYPYLLPHANYLYSKYSRLKMKIHEIPEREPYQREVDVISFTQADRIRQDIKSGNFNTGR